MDRLTPLVIAAQAGDLDAFNKIVVRFQDMAYATAYAVLGDFHLAQDAAQEAFIDAYLSLSKLREPAAFPGWFRKVVFKHSDRLIRRKRVSTTPIESAHNMAAMGVDPATAAEVNHLRVVVRDAITALPEDQRLVTTLFYMTGYSQKEIAVFLEVPVSTVKKRLFTARKRLYERMETIMTEYLQENRPSHTDEFSKTVQLFLALQVGDRARVKTLLQDDPSLINTQCEYQDELAREFALWPTGRLPIDWAVALGNKDIVKVLLDYQADPNVLHTAVLFNHLGIVEQLLNAGADINATAHNGQTPLHFAAIHGNDVLVERLIDAGAKISPTDQAGRTPLDWASLNDHAAVVNRLLAKGATTGTSDEMKAVTSASTSASRATDMLETGIKIIDLFSPLKRGGTWALLTPCYGLGQMVALGELIHRLAKQYNGQAVWVGEEKRQGGKQAVQQALGEGNVQDNVTLVWREVENTQLDQVGLMRRGIEAAGALREQGCRDVLLIIDSHLAATDALASLSPLQSITDQGAISTLFIGYGDDLAAEAKAVFESLDNLITFDPVRAKQRLYPAIDPILSSAKTLTENKARSRQAKIVAQAQQLLQRYSEIHDTVDADRVTDLSEADQLIALRGRRLHRYLTQPFYIAQTFTTLPAHFVTLTDTLQDCEALLAGNFDNIDENALAYLGTLTEVK